MKLIEVGGSYVDTNGVGYRVVDKGRFVTNRGACLATLLLGVNSEPVLIAKGDTEGRLLNADEILTVNERAYLMRSDMLFASQRFATTAAVPVAGSRGSVMLVYSCPTCRKQLKHRCNGVDFEQFHGASVVCECKAVMTLKVY